MLQEFKEGMFSPDAQGRLPRARYLENHKGDGQSHLTDNYSLSRGYSWPRKV